MLRWSAQNGLSQSAAVKSSAIWFLIVPIAARVLSKFNPEIPIQISGREYFLLLQFPFYWQLLFFASLFFMLASIVYSINAKAIVKQYSSYSEFKEEGNSRLQINQHFKDVVWDNGEKCIAPGFIDTVEAYLKNYCTVPGVLIDEIKNKNDKLLPVLEDLDNCQSDDSDAFYFVSNIADTCSKRWLITSIALYFLGFAFLLSIALMNIWDVTKTLWQ